MNIVAYGPDFAPVGIIDVFESLIWTDRYYAAGDFELYTSMSADMVTLLSQTKYFAIRESEHMMIIESLEIKSDVETGSKLLVKGRSLETILEKRIVWSQTILSGNLQTEIQRLLTENAINPTDASRKITKLTFQASVDPAITDLLIDGAQYTGDYIYDVISTICEVYNIGFKITLTDAGNFLFELYSGEDRSYNQVDNPYVIFSPTFDNLINSDYFLSDAMQRTVTLVAGEGEGIDRVTGVVEAPGGAGTELLRRELFTDARDLSSNTTEGTLTPEEYQALLTQRGVETLAKNVVITTFSGQFDTSKTFIYGTDFFMGDLVQVENEYGHEAISMVIELIFSENATGVATYPTFSAFEV